MHEFQEARSCTRTRTDHGEHDFRFRVIWLCNYLACQYLLKNTRKRRVTFAPDALHRTWRRYVLRANPTCEGGLVETLEP